MTEDEEEMEREMHEYDGKIIYCGGDCRIRFEFSSMKIIEENCDPKDSDIIGG